MDKRPNPAHIMQVGMGFWGSRTLLSAVELGLFSALGDSGMTGPQIKQRLGLHPRSLYDFLDALVALKLLEREGDGPAGVYRNTADTKVFLDEKSPAYMGGILEMAGARLYRAWDGLTTCLKTGEPNNESGGEGETLFDQLYSDERKLEQFLRGMQGAQLGNFQALLSAFDFSKYGSLCDVGGGNGIFVGLAAQRYPKLACSLFELPQVIPIAKRQLDRMGVSGRVEVMSGDFFRDNLPRADVIVMGNILHDWDEDQKKALIRKARASLNDGGAFIAVENVIDDARRENAFGLLMSLNMLIELPGGFDYTGAQFTRWCREAGFRRTEFRQLAGPASAAIAYL